MCVNLFQQFLISLKIKLQYKIIKIRIQKVYTFLCFKNL